MSDLESFTEAQTKNPQQPCTSQSACFVEDENDCSTVDNEIEVTTQLTEELGISRNVQSDAVDSYESIKRFFLEQNRIGSTLPIDEIHINSCNIYSTLRPYQIDTVKWMIMKETKSQQMHLGTWCINLPSGGILADEMGLGKTVEVLACIIGHVKERIEPRSKVKLANNVTDNRTQNATPGKRSSTTPTKASFLKKKPRLTEIKQNPTLKVEIAKLLDVYYNEFQRKLHNSSDSLNEKSLKVIEICFKVILLNCYYNQVNLEYARQQSWGYLVSEFDVDELDSIGYNILLKSMSKKNIVSLNATLSDEDVTIVLSSVTKFLNDKVLKKFEKEFYLKMRYSINKSAGEFIPLMETKNVRCSCGSDRTKGRKVKCSTCQTMQHLECVGMTEEPVDPEFYYCPICWMSRPKIESAATLIVVPGTLTQQWIDEIQKHAADCHLKVYWYQGVKNHYVLPPILASYDIVLITFHSLGADLSFTNNNARSLRHVKRYQSFITPLTCIKWWRLCIDEAQTVESVNRVSEMAALLETVHLWAVTGTPVGKSLHDLYGLTTFLRMKPFIESNACWIDLISGDQSLLHTLFAHLMRRKTKEEVNDQLQLPELRVQTQWLSFSPTEGYFYNSTHVASQQLFMEKVKNIKNLDQSLNKANRRTVESILSPLLSLRQACVNPMAVGSVNLFSICKGASLPELLEKMIKKTKIDCEEILRMYIMFVNGSARLFILDGKFSDAVALYRGILLKINIYNDLKPDNFQIIHIMHNLHEAALKDLTIELTEKEKQFPEKISAIEEKCLGKLQEELTTMKQQLSKYDTEISNYSKSFDLKHFEWWEKMLKTFDYSEILSRVYESLKRDHIEITSDLKIKLSSGSRLKESLKYWLSDIESKRAVVLLFIEKITDISSRECLWSVAESCHIRKNKPKSTCSICRMENVMLKYESILFNVIKKSGSAEAVSAVSNWKHSGLECVLNVLLSCSRTSFGKNVDNTNAAHQIKMLAVLKREFRAIRAIWRKQCDLLHVFDEIHMAKSTCDIETNVNLPKYENMKIEHQLDLHQAQSASTYLKLQSKYGSLQYLKNLERRYNDGECVEEACPVCHMSMDEKRAVMICGHFTCYGCMQSLIKLRHSNPIICPICRSSVPLTSITYVHGGGSCTFDSTEVEGNYSIKILAITSKILKLVKEEPRVKILVFSTWERALDVFESAFKQNSISFQRYSTGNKRRVSLALFKNKDFINVLLIPLRSGSKGLNITEASHIIFTEPILNLFDEKQAVGRIYRLGQTRQMIVHKFIVKSTVEEHLHRMIEELQQNKNNEGELTFRNLLNLFEVSSSDLK